MEENKFCSAEWAVHEPCVIGIIALFYTYMTMTNLFLGCIVVSVVNLYSARSKMSGSEHGQTPVSHTGQNAKDTQTEGLAGMRGVEAVKLHVKDWYRTSRIVRYKG